jgi:3-hydroxyacyl-[acyl-carrier-protein] dehydratase
VRFKNSVKPGDTVEVEATLTYHRANIYICSAVLSVGGKMCVKGELSFALLPDTRNK